MLPELNADYRIGGSWGNSISWFPSDQFETWNGDENHIFKVAGHKQIIPKEGQTLLGEFEYSWIIFTFVKIERLNDPKDQFFADVKPLKQIMKKEKQMEEQTTNINELPELQKILFFDTETSGFIKKDLDAKHPDQAWTVQIGALLTDTEGKQIDSMNVIIKSYGREMNPFAEEVHGISSERADEEGIEEVDAAEQFGLLLRQASLVVGHNFDFDWKYAQHLLERNMDNLSDEARSAFYLDLPNECTMKNKKVVKFCGLKNKANRPKWPKLIELHETLFDEGFEDAHDAFADISATAKCYFELVKRGIIEDQLKAE